MKNWLFECGKEWYHFQQELMMSKIVVEVLGSFIIITFTIGL